MSEAFSNTLTVIAMEHHDLQKCTWQNQGGPGCKEESPPSQWLLTTIWHKQQIWVRCELKEENLASLRLTIFLMFGVSGPLYLKPCSDFDKPKLRISRYSHNDSHVILN